MADKYLEYGIKYRKIKLDDSNYLLIPMELVTGYTKGRTFYNGTKTYRKVDEYIPLPKDNFVVDGAFTIDELCGLYEYDDGDVEQDFLIDYYFTDEKEDIILLSILPNGYFRKKRFCIKDLLSKTASEIYEEQKKKPSVVLNQGSLEELLSIDDIDALKEKLKRYEDLIENFIDRKQNEGITRVAVENGHVVEVHTNKAVVQNKKPAKPSIIVSDDDDDKIDLSGISLSGLEKYIKERVFGHDEEIEIIAKTIIMNYRAKKKFGTEPILIVGPTGTGKTATMSSAAEYLNIPFIDVNTANLVPQGIRGQSIEDYLFSLIVQSGYDLKKAQRSLIFFDELDKIGESDLEIKSAVKEIMLKFLEGTIFTIDKDKASEDYNFNTRMLNKAYAGAFQSLFDTKASIGFGARQTETVFNRKKIYQEQYFGKELVTRIPHIIIYNPLDRATQKRAILHSKLSVLMQKKMRYEEEFNVTLDATQDYIEAILDMLEEDDKSMRDLNNIIIGSLNQAERAMLNNEGQVSRLILTPETVLDPHKFTLE